MKVLILTYGTRGDVQPYLALGKGLKKAGHHVTLGTSHRFREFVQSHGLEFGYMNDELLAILETTEGKDILENTNNVFQVIGQFIKLSKKFGPIGKAIMNESWDIAREVKPDYILYSPKTNFSPFIAEKLGIKCALATPIPMFVPTSEYPSPGFPELKFGGWYNRFGYKVVNSLGSVFLGKYLKNYRKELGLPAVKKIDLLKDENGHNIPVLHAYSQHVLPRPNDWPDSAYVTGSWFLDEDENWTPPYELQAFLGAGDPPVYVGFGSMSGRNPERLTLAIVEALQAAGVRGILATGWGGLRADALPDTILKIDSAPHAWLFPHMAAVVHHGGAGTTAAGLRAGKPSIVTPFFGDQPFWAKRLHKLGVSPKPIPQKKLTRDRLTQALIEVTTNQDMINTAESLGQKMRREDGVVYAVSLIEQFALKKTKDTQLLS